MMNEVDGMKQKEDEKLLTSLGLVMGDESTVGRIAYVETSQVKPSRI